MALEPDDLDRIVDAVLDRLVPAMQQSVTQAVREAGRRQTQIRVVPAVVDSVDGPVIHATPVAGLGDETVATITDPAIAAGDLTLLTYLPDLQTPIQWGRIPEPSGGI